MATVHLGRLRGELGFGRTVAIKRLRPVYAHDPEFVSMFLDEARMASRVRHPNVVSTLDIVIEEGELLLVMDYVDGESLWRLIEMARERKERIPHRVAAAIVSGMLQGLHAAHEVTDERGQQLGLVHRDVSPHNVLVGRDGLARVLDFGIVHALERVHVSQVGTIKGKFGYMAPEQLEGRALTRRADIYAASVVLWELLTGSRLFPGLKYRLLVSGALAGRVPPPSRVAPGLPRGYDRIVAKGLAEDPADRYGSAREMAWELEACDGIASATVVSAWLERLAGDALRAHADCVARVEHSLEPCKIEDLRESVDRMLNSSESIVLGREADHDREEPWVPDSGANQAEATVTPTDVSTRTGVNFGSTVNPPNPKPRRLPRVSTLLALAGVITCCLAIAVAWWPYAEPTALGAVAPKGISAGALGAVATPSDTSSRPTPAFEPPARVEPMPSSSSAVGPEQDRVSGTAGVLRASQDKPKRTAAPRFRVTRRSSAYAFVPGDL